MARLPRLALAGHVHHILQRGNGRESIVTNAEESAAWLDLLLREARRLHVAVHGYLLMPDHFHLLATPRAAPDLGALMQALGRGYVRRFNQAHGRRGSLWEGRFRSCVLQAERYLLPCMVHLDLHPVRAGLVANPGDYRWSSHGHYAGLRHESALATPAAYWALGNTPFAREAAYAEMVHQDLGAHQREALTRAVLGGWALGDEAFLAALQPVAERRLLPGKPGRPRKHPG